ncbi:hypothetical protein WMZ97_06035 [Lentibacillus sp. N15]|uniref:hypothetical protein n=1 Tax=Lentibacillus songyuanensis TaxID=3136161 RepID=UPI0031BB6932
MFFGLFDTDTEKKRDDYYKLYEKLKAAQAEHNKKVSDAESSYQSYTSSMPYLYASKIPSDDFEAKRMELNAELNKYFNYEKDKLSQLETATNQAYQQYEHYKDLAIKEAEEAKEKREKELKELADKVGGWFNV